MLIQDDIIRMARDAGFMLVTEPDPEVGGWYECFEAEIERFAALAYAAGAAAEREACAKVCDEHAQKRVVLEHQYISKQCAAAIRARGQA
jgi:hypothetical protein